MFNVFSLLAGGLSWSSIWIRVRSVLRGLLYDTGCGNHICYTKTRELDLLVAISSIPSSGPRIPQRYETYTDKEYYQAIAL